MKHILVGISYSELTSITLRYSLKLAQHFGAKLTLVHVATLPKEFTFQEDLSEIEVFRTKEIEKLKAAFSRHYGKEHHTTLPKFRIIFGKPTDELILLTRELEPDLLVIGVPEHKYWVNLRFINRPMEIAEAVKCPVLLIPIMGAFYHIDQIAFATNFSLEDVGALMELKEWATIFKSKIHCIHVCKKEKDQPEAERKMNILKKIFKEENLKFTVTVGDEEDMLEKLLIEDKVNLVAMLKRNKALWYDTVKPSLTEKIADDTWIPLLIYNQK